MRERSAPLALAGPQVAHIFGHLMAAGVIGAGGGQSGDGKVCLGGQPTELACTSLVAVL